jgi:hypothetical protein
MFRNVMAGILGGPLFAMLVFMALVTLPGCSGGKMRPVHGKVHFPDGTPLDQGKVQLNAVDGLHGASSGPLGKDGSFEMTSLKKGDGVPIGMYRVSIVGAAEAPKGDTAGPPKYLIDPRYVDSALSGITFEVTADGENFLDITVQKPARK